MDYDAMREGVETLRTALTALEIALRMHPNDTYLHGQAREAVGKAWLNLMRAAGELD